MNDTPMTTLTQSDLDNLRRKENVDTAVRILENLGLSVGDADSDDYRRDAIADVIDEYVKSCIAQVHDHIVELNEKLAEADAVHSRQADALVSQSRLIAQLTAERDEARKEFVAAQGTADDNCTRWCAAQARIELEAQSSAQFVAGMHSAVQIANDEGGQIAVSAILAEAALKGEGE